MSMWGEGVYRGGSLRGGGGDVQPLNSSGPGSIERITFAAMHSPVAAVEPEQDRTATDAVATIREQAALLALQSAQAAAAAELEDARREARTAALMEMEQGLEVRLSEVRAAVVKACEEFRLEKESYFLAVEREVVKLSLAVAHRVLRREVRTDPTLLRGVVRVALERVAEESTAVLRVAPGDEEAWKKEMERKGVLPVTLEPDASLDEGECMLIAEAGRVRLGVASQLEEIEKGFFDLLEQRPTFGSKLRAGTGPERV